MFAIDGSMLENVLNTVRDPTSSRRWELLRNYARIKFNQSFYKNYPRFRRDQERVLGFKVHYLDYGLLALLFEEIFIHQDYYFECSEPAPRIIDCGSNIGVSVLYFKSLFPAAQIVSFEPDPKAFGILQRNVETNRLSGVTLHNKAVFSSSGPLEFYYDPDSPGSLLMSTRQERMGKAAEVVDAVALSNYVNGQIDFLKMDIEGAERGVLAELAERGKLANIEQIALEYHHHINEAEDVLSSTLKLLEENGFGYHIRSQIHFPVRRGSFQDVLVRAYRQPTKS